MIAPTSLEAYYSIDNIECRRAQVLDYIRCNPDKCAEQIVIGMKARSHNSVAPRITELLNDTGDIYVSGYTTTSTGRRARTYRATILEG